MHDLIQDVRFAVRGLLRDRTFTVVASLTLALGMGGNAALFSAVRSILLRPMPGVRADDRSVWLSPRNANGRIAQLSYPDFLDVAARTDVLESAAAFWRGSLALAAGGADAERVNAYAMSPGYFDVLGARVSPGRDVGPAEIAGRSRC
ncbi:MAG: ABC transporter permease [Gemmatimonadetes bacterium]|nr:ABC transporter permease [Gemmatimonadota bacterium]